MAIPADTIANEEAKVLRRQFAQLKLAANNLIAECNTGTVKLGDLAGARLQAFINHKEAIESLSAVSGVGSEYEGLYSTVFDFDVEKDSVLAALNTLNNYIITQYPKMEII